MSIEIPEGVTTIEDNCFWGCRALKTIHIPESVTVIGKAILAQNNLETITGKFATPDNKSLIYQNILVSAASRNYSSYTVPAGVIKIGAYCFHSSNLERIILNDELQELDNNSFQRTILKEIYLPKNVVRIGILAFNESKLEKIVFAEDALLKRIEDGAFNWAALKSIDLPQSLEFIGSGALCGCPLKSLVLPHKITTIPSRLCYYSGVESVKFEGDVTLIGEGAFLQCNLKEITIPGTVRAIEYQAFNANESLENVYCYPIEPPGIGLDAFTTNENLLYSIYVPADSYVKYKNSSSWTQFAFRLKPMGTL
jgi:hypothetical protein